MVDNKWLGQKSKQGFYKKIDKGVIHSIDLDTLEYSPQSKKRYAGVRLAKEHTTVGGRVKALVNSDDTSGQFIWEVTSKALLYSADRLGEIADDIVNIDRAMRWGFGWEMGPFEIWDAIGVCESVSRLKAENKTIPGWVSALISTGNTTFYKRRDGFIFGFQTRNRFTNSNGIPYFKGTHFPAKTPSHCTINIDNIIRYFTQPIG
jgi:3-hydroxyacyl-CoA dehydrogenase